MTEKKHEKPEINSCRVQILENAISLVTSKALLLILITTWLNNGRSAKFVSSAKQNQGCAKAKRLPIHSNLSFYMSLSGLSSELGVKITLKVILTPNIIIVPASIANVIMPRRHEQNGVFMICTRQLFISGFSPISPSIGKLW